MKQLPVRLVLLLPLIGRKIGARFLNEPQSVEMAIA